LRVARECGSLIETAWAHYYRAGIVTRTGDHAEGVAHSRRAAGLFREAGEPMYEVISLSYSGVLLQRLGRLTEAVETHRACVAAERTLRATQRGVALENAAQLLLRLADALGAAGDHDEALGVVAEAEDLVGQGAANLRSMARLTRGRTLLSAGRLAEAREQLTGAVDALSDPEVKVAVLMELAGLCDRMNDQDAAIRHRVRALAESERYESPGMTKLQHDVAGALGIDLSA
jgi:tetratricopeptide (TPR) repeat protein